MLPDINVLVAASRADHTHHKAANLWLRGACTHCAAGTATLVLPPLVLAGFLRLVTNARVFVSPATAFEAIAFADALLAVPGVAIPTHGDEWPVLRKLCIDQELTGNNVPDAWLAATVRAMGEHLVTFDKGFRTLLTPREMTLLRG